MRPSQLLRNLAAARAGRTPAGPADPTELPRPTITEDEAFTVIRDAITAVLDVPAAGVARETRLAEDLKADSLALVEIVELVEERLAEGWPGLVPASFRLEDAGLEDLQTVGDAVTYVVTSL
jgi:acyl carrier protein